jgi:hypothetical protein
VLGDEVLGVREFVSVPVAAGAAGVAAGVSTDVGALVGAAEGAAATTGAGSLVLGVRCIDCAFELNWLRALGARSVRCEQDAVTASATTARGNTTGCLLLGAIVQLHSNVRCRIRPRSAQVQGYRPHTESF